MKNTRCNKRHVWAKAYRNDALVASSENYHPDGCDCTDVKGEHSTTAIHAEIGCLGFGADIIEVSYQPCFDCSQAIFNDGIKTVIYHESKPSDTRGIDFLVSNGVKVECKNLLIKWKIF